ncbi:MAG: hypothetical protein HETSPECPRED_002881 [Heterodermia speciosa]|uniref:NAD-dependent epimerase/dehydratase domain-containing protein n=1 Tax=Heterodermia speciosa TaxID=116794 RepID=A0A8H3J5Q6_9LECA|nr:MAG: hypothetical protein HETSPECPRED_002881 [Heterodermia speciosa]
MAPTLHGKSPAIAPGSLVLVTGVNGYIASHVADQLIQAGYRVRGTARDTSKTAWVSELFDKRYGEGKFEPAIVGDMAEPGAFDEATQGVSGVVHVASVVTFDHDPNKVIPQVIAGAVNAIEAAAKTPSVKRFVYTSSSTAITAPRPNEKYDLKVEDWNTADVEAAWKPPPYEPTRNWAVYGASKTQAEQAIWKFAKEKKPDFVVNAVLPNANIGEILSEKQPASTGAWAKALYYGGLDKVKDIPPQWMVNVKDTARIHVSALIDADVENERILAYAYPFNWNDILASLRSLYPDKTFNEDIPNAPRDLSIVDNSRGAELLRAHGREGWTSLEESVKDNTIDLK